MLNVLMCITHVTHALELDGTNYWQVEYLAICSNNAIGEILNWQISVLYGEKPMLVV